MILKQYYLACLSHASYLIADETTRLAVVVDPQRDVEQYLVDAERLGLKVAHVALTHLHADFIAGHLELQARTSAEIHLGAAARTDFACHALTDGATIDLGGVKLVALATPGHTPESTTFAVFERGASQPAAILTGDTLFIGDVGRPDLLVSVGMNAEELAGRLYDSLRAKILPLPDEVLVYPAHGAGSACGKNLSKDTFSTLGVQKATNWALQPIPRADFIAELCKAQSAAPAYFAFDADLNRRSRPTLDKVLEEALRPVPLAELKRLVNAGAVVVDAREPDDYARGHLRGSLNLGLSGKYANWAGELLRPDQPLVLVAPPGREREAAVRLGRIGFDRVVGFLEGGLEASGAALDPTLWASHPRWHAAALRRRLAQPAPPLVVDVRAQSEWDAGHIEGALHVPLPRLRALAASLPRDVDLVLQCQGGYRSSIAASILESQGFTRLSDLIGGWNAWTAPVSTT
jgi:hydroxyacylglutathione hydrolase